MFENTLKSLKEDIKVIGRDVNKTLLETENRVLLRLHKEIVSDDSMLQNIQDKCNDLIKKAEEIKTEAKEVSKRYLIKKIFDRYSKNLRELNK